MLVVPLLALQQKAGLGELESKGTAPDTGQGDDIPPPGGWYESARGSSYFWGGPGARAPEERVPARLTSLCADRPQGSSAILRPRHGGLSGPKAPLSTL